jgi:hypothetical protein
VLAVLAVLRLLITQCWWLYFVTSGPTIDSVVPKHGQTLATAGGGIVIVSGDRFGVGDVNQLMVKVGELLVLVNSSAMTERLDSNRLHGVILHR